MDAIHRALRPVLQHPVTAASVILIALIWPFVPEAALIPLVFVGLSAFVIWQSRNGTKAAVGTKGAVGTTAEPVPKPASGIFQGKSQKEAVVPGPDVHISDDEFPRAGQC